MIDVHDLNYQSYLPQIKNYDAWSAYLYLVDKALKRKNTYGLKEKHHIVPKCYLPLSMSLEETFIGNKVILTAKEHYKAHYYLAKALNDNKMISAFKYMSYNYKYTSSNLYMEEDTESVLKQKHYRAKSCPYKRYWNNRK